MKKLKYYDEIVMLFVFIFWLIVGMILGYSICQCGSVLCLLKW